MPYHHVPLYALQFIAILERRSRKDGTFECGRKKRILLVKYESLEESARPLSRHEANSDESISTQSRRGNVCESAKESDKFYRRMPSEKPLCALLAHVIFVTSKKTGLRAVDAQRGRCRPRILSREVCLPWGKRADERGAGRPSCLCLRTSSLSTRRSQDAPPCSRDLMQIVQRDVSFTLIY